MRHDATSSGIPPRGLPPFRPHTPLKGCGLGPTQGMWIFGVFLEPLKNTTSDKNPPGRHD